MPSTSSRRHRGRRVLLTIVSVIVSVVVATVVAFNVSPWPGVLVIRSVFQSNAEKVLTIMGDYAPTSSVDSQLDVAYQPDIDWSKMDVFYPTGTTANLGTIVWTHGGA